MRATLLITALLGLLLAANPARADAVSYFIWDDYGGSYTDAEKSSDDTDDNLMCWAASASNVLWYTGWGWVEGMTGTDAMFAYFQDHWTDQGGNPYYGWDWWFDGTNGKQGAAEAAAGWAQENVEGGNFFPSLSFSDYVHWDQSSSSLMNSYASFLQAGYASTFSIQGNIAHSITGWGYNYDTNSGNLLGVWVSDSDDDKGGSAPRPDSLRYYSVVYEDRGHADGSKWYMPNYGTDNFISEVISLEIKPGFEPVPIPEPGSLVLMGLGGLGLLWLRRRRRAS